MESLSIAVIIKQYLLASLFALFGGVAHAIQQVKRAGWKGWMSFISDIIVCIFFGNVFYQLGSIVEPKYAIIATSLGSYWGAKSFEYLKQWIITTVNLPKI